MAVGCSAETGDESAQVGSSEQAIAIAGLANPTGYDEAKFPAFVKLSSTEVLVLGGYDHTGTAVSTIRKFTYNGSGTGTWSSLVSGMTTLTLSTARGEAEIMAIPGVSNKYLIVGGRSSEGGTRLDTAEIIDVSTPSVTALAAGATHKLASARVNFAMTKCGTSKLLVAGGDNAGAVKTLEVFSYDSTTPANSTFAVLQDTGNVGSPHTVVMRTARAFPGALSFSSDTKILVAAGESGGTQLGTSEKIVVNSSCQVTNATQVGSDFVPAVGAALPSSDVRSQFVFAPVSLTISLTAYDALLAAGTDGSATPPTTSYAYDATNDAWVSGPALNVGHVRPAYAPNSSSAFAIVGGWDLSNSINDVDTFSNSGSGSFAASNMTNKRLGGWAASIGSTYVAGHGTDTTPNPDTYFKTPE
jgi:hypothetical protein